MSSQGGDAHVVASGHTGDVHLPCSCTDLKPVTSAQTVVSGVHALQPASLACSEIGDRTQHFRYLLKDRRIKL